MNIGKLMKNIRGSHLVILAAAAILGYALYNYSTEKSLVSESMKSEEEGKVGVDRNAVPAHILRAPESPNQGAPTGVCSGSYQPSAPLGQNSGPAGADGVNTNTQGLPPSCANKEVVNPAELLPKDMNSEWAKLNPMGSGDLQNVNLLKAGYHIGINTVSSSLRNANLQLRSEPANPQNAVGPWNNTTITPDVNRRPLEIGCGSAGM